MTSTVPITVPGSVPIAVPAASAAQRKDRIRFSCPPTGKTYSPSAGEDDDLDVEAVEDWAVGEEEDLEDCCWKDSCLTKTCEADADRVPPALCC